MSKKKEELPETAIEPTQPAQVVVDAAAYKAVILEKIGEMPSKYQQAIEVLIDELAKLQTK